MSAENAGETLDGIEAGRIARCLLPWVPLMSGGNEATITERWKQIAATEPESRRRADYGGLASVFSELTGGRELWKRALEGWNMRESQQVLEWQAEARAEALKEGRQEGWREGRQDALLDVVRLQFGSALPDELMAQVRSLTDNAEISRWFEAAVKSQTFEQFQLRVNGRR
jgi:flagellar biosynthesis/type III secretory pathway protein FliH